MVRPRTERSWRAKAKREFVPSPHKTTSIVLAPHQVILRPMVTEKGMHRSTTQNQYTFEINTLATKHDVRRAVEELFNVKVTRIATQNRRGKARRTRFRLGRTQDWKKAVVTLRDEDKINFF